MGQWVSKFVLTGEPFVTSTNLFSALDRYGWSVNSPAVGERDAYHSVRSVTNDLTQHCISEMGRKLNAVDWESVKDRWVEACVLLNPTNMQHSAPEVKILMQELRALLWTLHACVESTQQRLRAAAAANAGSPDSDCR